MKFSFTLFVILVSVLTFAQEVTGVSKDEVVESYTCNTCNFEILYKKSAIPAKVKKQIKREYGKFNPVNPGKKFNKTDVYSNPFLSHQGLLFVIKHDNYYAIVYEQGGRGLSTNLLFAELQDKKVISLQKFHLHGLIEKPEDFFNAVKLGEFRTASF